jgi:hypothetical protein
LGLDMPTDVLVLEQLAGAPFRDARTATLMPPNADRAMELTGKAMLDITDDVLLARHAG